MASAAIEQNEPEESFEVLSDDEFHKELTAIAPHLRAFARSLCGNRDEADDLAQSTMLRAWAARDRYRAGTNFKAWTFTILRNKFYGDQRRARFHADYDEGVAESVLRTHGDQEDSIELGDVIRALDALPDSHREVLILVAVGSLSYEEIADICGIALGTVKSRISRARAMLANVMDSGQLPDFRHNFVLSNSAIDLLFDELARVANRDAELTAAA